MRTSLVAALLTLSCYQPSVDADGAPDGPIAPVDARAGDAPVPRCGDELVEAPEECDDANAVDADGCTTRCLACTGPTYQGRCYQFVNTYVPWASASSMCGQMSGHLVTYATVAEAEAVYPSLGSTQEMWIGYHDRNFDAEWQWVTFEADAYVDFVSPPAPGTCAAHQNLGNPWLGQTCGTSNPFVCERQGWSVAPWGHAYLPLWDDRGWDEAAARCDALEGHLATFTSLDEEEFVRALVPTEAPFWIGLSDVASPGSWRWLTDETLEHIGWESSAGQPNGGSEHCAVSEREGWHDYPCDRTYAYVCEREL